MCIQSSSYAQLNSRNGRVDENNLREFELKLSIDKNIMRMCIELIEVIKKGINGFYELDYKKVLLNLEKEPSCHHSTRDHFNTTKRLGLVAYHLALQTSLLDPIHDFFHVSILGHFLLNPSHVINSSNYRCYTQGP